MPRPVTRFLSFAMLGMVTACAVGPAEPPRSPNSQLDAEPQIDDDAIRQAFEARPQMPASAIRLSYYTFDPEIAGDLDKTLSTLPGVSSVYHIPPLLVDGQRRYQENEGHYQRSSNVSIKKLRLLAARAKTDVLVVVDHGRRSEGINPLVGFTLFIATKRRHRRDRRCRLIKVPRQTILRLGEERAGRVLARTCSVGSRYAHVAED